MPEIFWVVQMSIYRFPFGRTNKSQKIAFLVFCFSMKDEKKQKNVERSNVKIV